jgi:uncharacterized membrane protein YkvA (DUF1232 family)
MKTTKFSKEDAERVLKEETAKVKEEDLEKVIKSEESIIEKVLNNKSLQGFFEDIKLLFSLVKDYVKGDYKEIPLWTISAVVASLLYVLSPIDTIPDFIPFIGYIDDAAVVSLLLSMMSNDLSKYKEWINTEK